MATIPEAAPPAPVGNVQALVITLVLIPLIGIYIAIGASIGIAPLFAGFLFILYWTSFKHMATSELLPGITGSLAGLGIASLLHTLPIQFGTVGMVVPLLLILVSIYLLIRNMVPFVVNSAMMLFLTIGTIPELQAVPFIELAGSVLLGAAYAGGLYLLITRVVAARAARAHRPMA